MRIEDIQEHLDKYNDYDIRQNKNCRFVDQKCTPDVVCFIADCILSTDCATKAFTVSDLWKTQFFIENLKSASNLNGNLNCSKELEHYAS